jgi:para-aminobenzoate synthetase/4-amino-4-deoxychorismate lyase
LIQKDEVLLKHKNEWLHFANPSLIISATKIGEVRGALREVERLVNANGWHAAGFVSYEAAPAFDKALRVIASPADDLPLLWFGLYSASKTSEVLRDFGSLPSLNWQPSVNREVYNAAIEKVKENIALGKTYQVNYTMRLNSAFDIEAWDLFAHLAQSQNKYAAYIDTGQYAICSASPELFFSLDGETITGRPMKGTVKRGRTTMEDREKIEWLSNSIKNRAENVMIVDMIRNDLGRIAEIGSVQAPELFTVEKYPTLFQMTSSVQAKTKAGVSEIFDALFPCASITGAPKVSTMNIIAKLETTPRKVYTGSIGYIAPNRKAQFNVAIRTAIIDRENKTAEYGVGGGIVWDSTSADEYGEALLKARVLTESPQEFSLIETLLWTPEEGYFLREEHVARIQDSADYFDFPFSREEFETCLDGLATQPSSAQRVRVLLNKHGELTAELQDFQAQEKTFKVCLAERPINTNNVFLFHKTTQRGMYPSTRGYDDILLYNENDELTEFTIGNLAIEINGERFTPPISCGLLAGTFRSYLLETGQIKERVIYKNELEKRSNMFLMNSVRKWVKVEVK